MFIGNFSQRQKARALAAGKNYSFSHEAAAGIAPANVGFADRCVATSPCRQPQLLIVDFLKCFFNLACFFFGRIYFKSYFRNWSHIKPFI